MMLNDKVGYHSIKKRAKKFGEFFARIVYPYESNIVTFNATNVILKGFRGDHISKAVRKGVFYEYTLLEYIYNRYGLGGIYVDVGAFIGNHSLFFSKICKADMVLSLEPYPPSFRLLKHNILKNGATNVKAYNLAAGKDRNHAKVSVVNRCNLGANKLTPSEKDGDVLIIKLDEIVSEKIKLIKIDTEGFALSVLRGCEETISKHHPILVVETHPDPLDLIYNYLRIFGYTLKGSFNATPTYIFE